jgi:anaerobic selenocysteine-containing dehydrogenase
VLVWSGPGGGGGARLAELAHALGFADKPGCGAFHLPGTPNALGVAAAWSVAADGEETDPEPIGLLVVSGAEAAADPGVRALAEQAERVVVVTMYHGLATGWADVVLPGTGALERDGTTMNLEGRVQRLRRAALPPCPDELAWISKLAAGFGVAVAPSAAGVYTELAGNLFRDLPLEGLGLQAPLPSRQPYVAPAAGTTAAPAPSGTGGDHFVGELRLQRYRPLFSGPAVERVAELEFHRPEAVVELSHADAERRGIATGDAVQVRSNGTSIELRARLSGALVEGVARIADEHAADLHPAVEVVKL